MTTTIAVLTLTVIRLMIPVTALIVLGEWAKRNAQKNQTRM